MVTAHRDRLRPEVTLAVALAAGDGQAVRAVEWEHVDEHAFLSCASRHQIDGLCHWQLRRLARDEPAVVEHVPDGITHGLRRAYAHHTLRNESLKRDLREVAAALASAGIQALVFKGPWLAFSAYPAPGARPIDDIDLGVNEADYLGTLDALERVGYRPISVAPASAELALRQAHFRRQIRLAAPGRRPVEIHFRMINVGPPTPVEHWVWDRHRTLSLGDREIGVPGPEAMVLHLALHATQHGFSVLRLLYDLRFALESCAGELDEDDLIDRARSLHCGAAMHFALLLAGDLAGAPPPRRVLQELKPAWARGQLFAVLWHLSKVRRLEMPQGSNATEASKLYLLEMGSMAEKLRYLRGLSSAAGGARPFLVEVVSALRSRRR